MRWLSASECAGLRALDEHRPEAVGVVGEDLVGDHVARDQPGDDAVAADGRASRVARAAPPTELRRCGCGCSSPPGSPKLPVSSIDQLLEVGVERRVRRLLDAEVLEDRHARRAPPIAPRGRAHAAPRRRRPRAQESATSIARERARRARRARWRARRGSRGRAGPPRRARRAAPPRQKASLPGRTWRWMSARSAVSVRRGSIDDQRARPGRWRSPCRIAPGAREAVRLPRVLADEHGDLGVLEVAAWCGSAAAEQLAVDPELAGLLLGERVRGVADAERGARRAAVAAAEVVALAAAAVVEDRVAAVGVADARRSAAATSAIAVSQSIASNVPSARRRSGVVRRCAAVLVVVEAQRLLARVALATRGGPCRRGRARCRPPSSGPRCRS